MRARPRTVKVSPPYRSTQSFKENPLFFLPLNYYLYRTLTRSPSRRGFKSVKYSVQIAAQNRARFSSTGDERIDSSAFENDGENYHADMVIYVYATQKNIYYELLNPGPTQRITSISSPRIPKIITCSVLERDPPPPWRIGHI